MLSPKRLKFRKQHKGRIKGKAQPGLTLLSVTTVFKPLRVAKLLLVKSKLLVLP